MDPRWSGPMGSPPHGDMPHRQFAHGDIPQGHESNEGPSDGQGKSKWGWFGKKKEAPTRLTLEQMGKNYHRFMRSLRDDLIGKPEAEDYVTVIEKERNDLVTRNQRYTKFRSHVQSSLYQILEPPKPNSEFEERKSPEDLFESFVDIFHQLRSRLHDEEQEVARLKRDLKEERQLSKALNDSHQEEVEGIKSKHNKSIKSLEDTHGRVLEQERFNRATEIENHRKEFRDMVHEKNLSYQTLQKHFLDASDDFQPRPDDKFDTDMRELKAKIQGLAQKDDRTRAQFVAKLHIGESFLDAPGRKAREKVLILEKDIWDTISTNMFAAPFRLFGTYGERMLTEVWKDICIDDSSEIEYGDWPVATPDSERVRHVVVQAIRENLINKGNVDSPVLASYRANLEAVRQKIERTISTVGSKIGSDDDNQIHDIVNAAATLSLECISQKARILPFMVAADEGVGRYHKSEIEDRNGRNLDDEDEEELTGTVSLFISPGLKRVGDGRGGSLNEPPKTLSKAQAFMTI